MEPLTKEKSAAYWNARSSAFNDVLGSSMMIEIPELYSAAKFVDGMVGIDGGASGTGGGLVDDVYNGIAGIGQGEGVSNVLARESDDAETSACGTDEVEKSQGTSEVVNDQEAEELSNAVESICSGEREVALDLTIRVTTNKKSGDDDGDVGERVLCGVHDVEDHERTMNNLNWRTNREENGTEGMRGVYYQQDEAIDLRVVKKVMDSKDCEGALDLRTRKEFEAYQKELDEETRSDCSVGEVGAEVMVGVTEGKEEECARDVSDTVEKGGQKLEGEPNTRLVLERGQKEETAVERVDGKEETIGEDEVEKEMEGRGQKEETAVESDRMDGAEETIGEDEVEKEMEGRGRKRRLEDRGRTRKRVRQSLRRYRDGQSSSSSSSSCSSGSSDSSSASRVMATVVSQELQKFEQRMVTSVGEMVRTMGCHIGETVEKGEKTMKEMERTVRHLKEEIQDLRREVKHLKETGSKNKSSGGTSDRARATGTERKSENKSTETKKTTKSASKSDRARETEKAASSRRLAGDSKELAKPKESKEMEDGARDEGSKGRETKDRKRGSEDDTRKRTKFIDHRGDARGRGRGGRFVKW